MNATAALPATRCRKAAMVVQMLLREGGDLPLTDLPEAAQARLTKELGALNMVDKATLHAVAEEFARELDEVGMTAPGSIEAALESLEGRISPATAARLREEAEANAGGDPWPAVIALEPEELLQITEAESPEICAVLLSKLSTDQAANLLGLMPGESARRVAYAMSKTTAIRATAIERIGTGLAKNYCGKPVSVFGDTAESRVGSILNSSAASIRDNILEGLLTEDRIFGENVRKAIFTFADIKTRLATIEVPKVLRDIDSGDLVRALSSATASGGDLAEAAQHILENMSTRMADNLREEMEEAGPIKAADGEAAQSAVVSAIRAAADAGTVNLIMGDPDD